MGRQSHTIKVTFADGSVSRCKPYTMVSELAAGPTDPVTGLAFLGALVNNEVTSLSYPLTADSTIEFLTIGDSYGWRIYRNSLSFLLAKAVSDLFPQGRLAVHHSAGSGLYWTLETDPSQPDKGITRAQLEAIDERLKEIVKADLEIERRKMAFTQAVEWFTKTGQADRLNLLRFRNPPRIVTHHCDGFSDLAHTPLATRTGVLSVFKLVHHAPGFLLQLPSRKHPLAISTFKDQPLLFQVFSEHRKWGETLKVNTVGRLNEAISDGSISEFILASEALHEKKIASIADMIAGRPVPPRVVLIAGPSSSGKTTFSKRLAVQLRVNGLTPHTMGTDDYFKDEDKSARDAKGRVDFEHIDTVDVELFNKHLVAILNGDEMQMPRFDFAQRKSMPDGKTMRLDKDEILIVEGIHGLNPLLTHMIPTESKFEVYVSALTQLALDSSNRISTTDNRLMRRMVRDSQFRGNAPLTTLRMWPDVRRGEKRWVFPFQGNANVFFNSALDYELAVLKPWVEPLLLTIKPSDREYAEARRLEAFLSNFLPVSDKNVPGTSILREYIGRSAFKY